jgi:hypothetical protein
MLEDGKKGMEAKQKNSLSNMTDDIFKEMNDCFHAVKVQQQ